MVNTCPLNVNFNLQYFKGNGIASDKIYFLLLVELRDTYN